MNYYPHHIGDFNNATRHLTRVERSVYRDAIELYYDTETPLTSDIERLQKRLICDTEEEKKALRFVLSEFFFATDEGFRHERCEAEIEKYHANTSAKARAGIASAAKRKQKSTHVEHVLSVCTTNHEPITNNQEPNKTTMSSCTRRVDRQPVNGKRNDAVEVLDYLNLKAERSYRPTDSNLKLIAGRLREGATVEDCKKVIDRKSEQWLNDDKMREYLRPATLFNATKFSQYQGETGRSVGNQFDGAL